MRPRELDARSDSRAATSGHAKSESLVIPGDRFLWAMVAFLTLVSVLNIATLLDERTLDWEESRILSHIERPLGFYLETDLSYNQVSKISHWLSFRLFRGHLLGLRLFAATFAMISVFLATFIAYRLLANPALVAVCMFVFGLGWFFLDYGRWGIISYSAVTVFYLLIFYESWKVSDFELTRMGKCVVVAACSVTIFFTEAHTMPAVAAAPLAVGLVHFARSRSDRDGLLRKLRGLAYFAVYPLVVVAVWLPLIFIPALEQKGFQHSSKYYQYWLYFAHNNQYESTVGGALRFYFDRAHDLLY